MSGLKSTIPTPILNGWKEIAKHLGKGVRTVQRYELELALPIRRPAGKPQGSVVATKTELDAWIKASSSHRSSILRQELPDNRAALADFRSVIAERHRLREETVRFRTEMHTSIERLRESLGIIHTRNIDESTPSR